MDSVLDIISVTIATLGFIVSLTVSLCGYFHNRFIAANEFLTALEKEQLIKAKKYVYNNHIDDVKNEEAALIGDFFHHWGLMARKKQLPMWVFDTATGVATCRLYGKMKDYIELRRKHDNDLTYGEHFEWLVDTLKKRKAIAELLLKQI